MRWIRFAAAIFFLVGAAMPVVAGEITTTIQSGTYKIIPGDHGLGIVMDGFGHRTEPGAPMLPEREVLIALPPGARVDRIEAQGVGGKLLRGTYRILPVPSIVPLAEPPRCWELAAEMRREWEAKNEDVYAVDDGYPKTAATITGSGSLRKYSYASISVCPFRYQPLTGRLTHYEAVRVTVHFSVVGQSDELMHDRLADRRASELFVNYEEIRGLYEAKQTATRVSAETYNYLIVTTDALAGAVAASNFIPWKTSLGYSVRTMLTTDPMIAGQPGGDLAQQIRNFLRNYYALWGIQYVLFVGDYATVPMRYCFPNPDDHTHNPGNYVDAGGSVPTDFYFADLSFPDDLSWDSDGDGYCGEYGQDNPDFLAEVYVGRVPVNDLTRITYALDKLVAYEADQGAWKDQVLQPGSILFYENQDYEGYPKIDGCTLLDHIETNLMSGWTVSRYSEQQGLDPSVFPWPAVSLPAFIDDWRNGQYGIVNWSGHGAPYGVGRTVWEWDDGDGVPETDGSDVMSQPMLIDVWCNLDDDFPSIVFAVSCNVGYPEPNGVGNLGIDLLTSPGFGASAGIVSSSRPAWISADVIAHPGGAESVCYEFNRHLITEGEKLGEALYDAKYYCYQNYGWDHYGEHINQFNFNLYGDPSLMRTDIATAIANGDHGEVQQSAFLMQNYPNPFNPKTEIVYVLLAGGRVKLEIFNALGQRVTTLVDERQRAGRNTAHWDGRNVRGEELASGVYFYRLHAGNRTETRKMVLMK